MDSEAIFFIFFIFEIASSLQMTSLDFGSDFFFQSFPYKTIPYKLN